MQEFYAVRAYPLNGNEYTSTQHDFLDQAMDLFTGMVKLNVPLRRIEVVTVPNDPTAIGSKVATWERDKDERGSFRSFTR